MRSFFKDKKEKDKERKAAISLLCPALLAKIKSEYWNDVVAEIKAHSDSLSDFASWFDEKSHATLLHIAAERGALPVLELLISAPGVNLNVVDKGGWAPLHSAASNKQVKACMILIEKGADPNILNDDKTPPLHYVARIQPFAEAIPLLELLVKKGVDLESKNKYGESAIQQAVSRMNKEAVQYLLAHKADPNSANQFGETALHKLARSAARDPKALEMMQQLVAGGADYTIRGRNGSVLELVEEASRAQVEAALKAVAPASLGGTSAPAAHSDPSGAFDLADSTSKLSLLMAQLKRKRSSRGLNDDADTIPSATDAPPSPGGSGPVPGSRTSLNAESPGSTKGSRIGGSSRLTVPGSASGHDLSPGSSHSSPRTDSTSSPATASSSARSRRESVQLVPGSQSLSLTPQPEEKETHSRRHNRSSSLPDNHNMIVRKTDGAKLILGVDGYRVENGKSGVPLRDLNIMHIADYYLDHFVDKTKGPNQFHKHVNFIGAFKAGPQCIVSVLAQADPSMGYRTIVRTKDGAQQIFIPASKISGKLEKDAKHMLEEELCNGGIVGATLYYVEDPELQKDLLEFEQNDPQKVRCLPVGVVYAKGEQTLAREMWDNEGHSERFEQFLKVLGDKVQLQGWGGYAGGLDVAFNKKGTHSIYTEHKGYSIMYHVSTMLPFVEADPLKLGRSRMIGNDVVNIIYHEGDVPYHPKTLTGAVTYVFIVIRPRQDESGNVLYRIACCSKETVPPFLPDLPDQLLTGEELRELLLAKILNGHFSAQTGPGLAKMYTRPREALLEELAIQYVPEIRKQKEKEREKEREREKELSAKVKREKEKEKEKAHK